MSQIRAMGRSSPRATYLGYALMIAASVVGFLVIRQFGETLQTTIPAVGESAAGAGKAPGEVLMHVLLALAATIAVGRVLGGALKFIGQPSVIGEVFGGIL